MDEKPKRRDINKYVKPHAADKWFDIGLELEVGDEDGDELEQIKDKLKADKDCFDAMIVKWLKKADPGVLTWKKLLSALEAYGATEAVRAVKENLFKESVEEQVTSGASPPKHTEASSQPTRDTTGDQPAEETVDTTDTDQPTTPDNAEGSLSTTDQQEYEAMALDLPPVDEAMALDLPPVYAGDIVRSKPTHRGLDDTPLSIEGPELPLLDFHLELGKDQQGQERKVRDYQQELADLGTQGKNYIVVAPTGSGKTLVAAIVISDHLQKGKGTGETRRVAFIVEKRPLAHQQAEEIRKFIPAAKVSCCVGDETTSSVKSSLKEGDHIVVCTAGKLFDDIRCGRLTLNNFSLLVFDECHHTRKKSPYAELMIRYLELKFENEKLPQVMGLTASPGAGDNPHLERDKTIDHLVNLCALMDATSGIKTVRKNKQELEQHTNKPETTVENSKPRDEREPFIKAVVLLMQELEKEVQFSSPFERWSQKYETQVQQNKFVEETSAKPEARNKIRVWELLRWLSRALDVYMELQYEDAVSVIEESRLLNLDKLNDFEKKLREKLVLLMSTLQGFVRVENPHLERIKINLIEHFTANKETRAILFVRTKKHAFSIQNWIESLPIASELGIKSCVVVGQEAGTIGEGMTQAEQQDSFKLFRDGKRNVLVATSIGEEGIDVPACNLVLRYQHVSNEIAKAQTIGRARAQGNSEGVTILSSSFKQRQETKNSELLALVDEILQHGLLPAGRYLIKKLQEEQMKILQTIKLERKLSDHHKSKYNPEYVQLICRTCKTPACKGSDIRVLNNTNYIVPGDEFKTKITSKKYSKAVVKAAMSITESIQCGKCSEHWGISCIWPNAEGKFPMLKCKCFMFIVDNRPIPVKKWSEAPFHIKPFEVDLDL